MTAVDHTTGEILEDTIELARRQLGTAITELHHEALRFVRAAARDLDGHLVDPTGSGRGRWVPDDRAMWRDDGTGAQRKDHLR